MANTSAIYARIDTGLKEHAEDILAQLGITPSSAIQMLYRQIVLRNGIPFDLHLPRQKPTAGGWHFQCCSLYRMCRHWPVRKHR